MDYNVAAGQFLINQHNLLKSCVYFAVRKCIKMNWLNNNDQFLFPNKKWEKDKIFQTDCLIYTLFNNKIQSRYGTNHWIPFTEQELNSRAKFDSNFMTDFIKGKIKHSGNGNLLEKEKQRTTPLEFSDEAKVVFEAGKNLWIYYHQSIKNIPVLGGKANVNASLYDIREYFQGRNEKGKMNNKSQDETYNQFISDLRKALQVLAKKIEPKVYEYGFLK